MNAERFPLSLLQEAADFFMQKPCIWPTGAVCLTNRARRGRETGMDMEEIQYLLGSAIFARAKKYVKCIESYECKTEENGVRHLRRTPAG